MIIDLPLNIQKSVRKYEVITVNGLELAPVLVREWDEFLIAQPALEVLHQTLPVRLMRVPLLSALYQMDFEAGTNGEETNGLFARALLALALSLRLGTGRSAQDRVRMFQIVFDPKVPSNLKKLMFVDNAGKVREILPAHFQLLRQIIAAQNGVRLESDKANPEIIKAEQKLASKSTMGINADVGDLIAAVAALSNVDESEIDEWPILKLHKRATAYRRIIDYAVNSLGEMNGVSWKGGNPVPHPFFEKIETVSGILTPLGESGSSSIGISSSLPKAEQEAMGIPRSL